MKQTSSKTSRNNAKKRTFRKAIREVEDLIKNKKKEDAKKAYAVAQKAIDKAAKNSVIAKNTASRKKARLSRRIKEME